MQCPEPLEGRFQPVRQCVIGRIHAGEQCVAARPRHLARIEHRAQCRRLVIRMVAVPAIPDIAPLLRLLAHLGDHRVSGHRSKEAVDIDLAKALRKRDMLLRCQLLVAEEHDPVIPQGSPDLGYLNLPRRGREIDPGNLRADKGRERRHPDVIVGHTFLPTVPVPLRRNQLHDRPHQLDKDILDRLPIILVRHSRESRKPGASTLCFKQNLPLAKAASSRMPSTCRAASGCVAWARRIVTAPASQRVKLSKLDRGKVVSPSPRSGIG